VPATSSGRTGEFRPRVINGWPLFAHPIFLDQHDALTAQVEALRRKDPTGHVRKNATKRLAAIARLAFEAIPQDPSRPEYRLGNTLGDEHKHWFRARFFQTARQAKGDSGARGQQACRADASSTPHPCGSRLRAPARQSR
jgi:hypothetical protein